ncbi:protein of unknown function [Cupriavidus neocaledonicus]|uniref:Uncharacterized protein n=1 Tax=Cupriavidus neocaledonicus TaxID=1040979 RepID=A0A375H6W8_9BURK|nr:hypothetical protein CBM2605_A160040 [Cupriavidus neocaledonicus]SPD46945.1 protein of unknown function [Cupriavidus neocaledonicus]
MGRACGTSGPDSGATPGCGALSQNQTAAPGLPPSIPTYDAKYESSCSRVKTVSGSVFVLIPLPRGVKDARTLHRIRRAGAPHRAGGSGPARHRFLFSPPQRGVRCPVVSLLARGNAEARLAAFSRAKKRAKVDHVPNQSRSRHPRKTAPHASGVSLPMQGTDAFGRIALFAPENTKHAGAFSAPAERERCSSMDGPHRCGPWQVMR